MAHADLDVVIFGASGFTGKYVVREFLKFAAGRKIALAGRNREKLASTLSWASAGQFQQIPHIPLIEARVEDQDSLLAMCRRTRLVLNCVGPYRLYGEPVVSACVETGVDYLDITGEPEFMERMELKYHQGASEKGSLVVSACGYDSIPAEFGLLHHLKQWTPPSVPNSVDCFLHLASDRSIVGNLGTWESAVLGVSSVADLRKLRAETKKSMARFSVPGAPSQKPGYISWNKSLKMWSVFLPSADSAVVRRTMSTIAAGGPPSIAEMEEGLSSMAPDRKTVYKPVHFGVYSTVPNIFGVLAQIWLGMSIVLFGRFAFGRRLLLRFPSFFSLGQFRRGGPTEEQVSAASFKQWFIGKGYSDFSKATSSTKPKPDMQIVTVVSGPEIGYITTPICLVQCALIVLDQRRELPKGGVYTPGVVFGTTNLENRLQENDISFTFTSKINIY